jgi:carbonic anhydrase
MKRTLQLFASLCLLSTLVAAQQTAALRIISAKASSPSTPSAEAIWAELMQGNARFVAGTPKPEPLSALRATLVKGQHPNVVVLACSDSRVAPELIFDQSLGDLFVVRAAGNIADAIGVGSIEYAVEHLHSSVLVVLGHTKCGAVTAACSKEKMPTPNLQALVDEINPAVSKVEASAKGDAFVEAAIQENIRLSAKNILAVSGALSHAVEEGKLTVYEAEYDLESGRVVRLETPGGSN